MRPCPGKEDTVTHAVWLHVPRSSDFSKEAPGLDIYVRSLGVSFREQVLLVLDNLGEAGAVGAWSHLTLQMTPLPKRGCGDSGSQVAEGLKSPRQTPQAHLQFLLPAARPFKDSGTFSPAAPVTVAVSIAVPSICRASRAAGFPGAGTPPRVTGGARRVGMYGWVSEQMLWEGSDLPSLLNCAEMALGVGLLLG